ncbi:MAG TPA: rhodanese-like domain-containing protein [Steroidobacteraceae bacterium]|nr:rhodanese-like domain-containing protein [Steroidobacteraceae bacterium]
MDRFLEYLTHHPLLAGGTVLLGLAALAYEASKARSGGQAVGPADAVRLLNQGALLLDVRTQAEFDSGHIIDAHHLPQEQIASAGENLKKFKDKVVIVCCESGARSGAAARVLRAQGFTQVANLRGGLQAWRGESLPLVKGDATKGATP